MPAKAPSFFAAFRRVELPADEPAFTTLKSTVNTTTLYVAMATRLFTADISRADTRSSSASATGIGV